MRRLLMLAALVGGSSGGCDRGTAKVATPAKTPSATVTELEGVWEQTNGYKAWQWEVRGDILMERSGPGRIETSRKPIVLSRATEPASIDGGSVGPGIYRIDGDTLVVCHGGPTRPTQFDDAGGKLLLYIFKRTAK